MRCAVMRFHQCVCVCVCVCACVCVCLCACVCIHVCVLETLKQSAVRWTEGLKLYETLPLMHPGCEPMAGFTHFLSQALRSAVGCCTLLYPVDPGVPAPHIIVVVVMYTTDYNGNRS